MSRDPDGTLGRVRTVSGSALLLLALGALLPVAVAAAIAEQRHGGSIPWPAAAVGALVGLTCLAVFAWLRDRGVRAAAGLGDDVTGLGSRRRLIADLEHATAGGAGIHEYAPLAFSREAVEQNTSTKLVLEPK